MRLFDLKSLSVSRKSSSSPTCLKGRLAPVSHVSCLGVWESVSAGQSRAERDIKRERERERETRELDFDWKNAKKTRAIRTFNYSNTHGYQGLRAMPSFTNFRPGSEPSQTRVLYARLALFLPGQQPIVVVANVISAIHSLVVVLVTISLG